MNLIQKMAAHESVYSNAEYQVYEAIMSNPQCVMSCTINQIADLSNSSVSAVMRFCQRLGYGGYKDYRYDMIQCLQSLKDTDTESLEVDDSVAFICDIFSKGISSLSDMDFQLLHRLAEDIKKAGHVYCFGIYRSSLAAQKCQYNLTDMNIHAFSAGDSTTFTHLLHNAAPDSSVLIFSVSGNDFYYRSMFETSGISSSQCYLITCNPYPRMSKYVDHIFVLPSTNNIRKIQIDEHAIMFAFIEILTQILRSK